MSAVPTRPIAARAFVRAPLALLLFILVIFVPAGTLRYLEAWIYIVLLVLFSLSAFTWLLTHDRELLERRLRTHEKERTQCWLIRVAALHMIAVYVVCGLDRRFEWSDLPFALVIAADAVIGLGLALFVVVLRTNRWASRVVEVVPDQQLVTSGPYAFVRHPMYVSNLLIYGATPVALGSWWGALLSIVFLVPIMAIRILNEETVLRRELPGYAEYCEQVRYRLVPAIW